MNFWELLVWFFVAGAIVINQETDGSITHLGIAIVFGLIVMLAPSVFTFLNHIYFHENLL